jgi:hypothetical protein
MPASRAVRWKFEFRSSGGADLKRPAGMTRAGHSDCQGGFSPAQTQRGNDSCAQIVLKNPLGRRERIVVATAIRADDLGPSPVFGGDRATQATPA